MAYIGKTPTVGNFVKLDALTASATASYTMQVDSVNFEPESVNHMLVSLNGVIQSPTTSYTISGSTITFASALTSSDSIDFIMVYGNVLDIGTPSDATVTNAKTNFVSTSSAAGLQIKGDGTTDGTLQLNCSQNSHGIKLKSPPHSASASYTLTFPNDDGDANQVLKTNGSGVLDWTTPSSGTLVQVAKVVNSSVGATSVEVQNCFTTTYKFYKIVCRMFRPGTDHDYCRMRLMTGTNTAVTATDYRRANYMYRSDNTTDTSSGTTDEFRILENVEDAAAESGGMFVMYASIDKNTSSSCSFKYTGTSSYTDGNAGGKRQVTGMIGGFYYNAISSVNPTGFLLRSANNITQVDLTVYGVVQS